MPFLPPCPPTPNSTAPAVAAAAEAAAAAAILAFANEPERERESSTTVETTAPRGKEGRREGGKEGGREGRKEEGTLVMEVIKDRLLVLLMRRRFPSLPPSLLPSLTSFRALHQGRNHPAHHSHSCICEGHPHPRLDREILLIVPSLPPSLPSSLLYSLTFCSLCQHRDHPPHPPTMTAAPARAIPSTA